ncbi:hypothetical protein HK099_008541 [Clydaea vesicula]|uniref:Uncharacterized protein n=1 Tax=Clydaea vesicula TaxID=447962 RepID=A0AAD5XXL2_9FUNG|nr:hypothetical protein HK099_008541 [Clydaea vesicula]
MVGSMAVLRAAVADGNLAIVRKLISNKHTVQAVDPDTGWPILFYAIKYSKTEIIQYLLEHEYKDTIQRDFKGNTALIIACRYKNIQAFNLYLRRFPQSFFLENNFGETPIFVAAQNGLRQIVSSLLDLGIDVNIVDKEGSTLPGWTPSDWAYSSDIKDYLNECVNALSEKKPIKLRSDSTKSSTASPYYTPPKLDLRSLF